MLHRLDCAGVGISIGSKLVEEGLTRVLGRVLELASIEKVNVQVADIANDDPRLVVIKQSNSKEDCLRLISEVAVKHLASEWQRAMSAWQKLRLPLESGQYPGAVSLAVIRLLLDAMLYGGKEGKEKRKRNCSDSCLPSVCLRIQMGVFGSGRPASGPTTAGLN